ncbi:MAG: prolipoprotein diacylglyceryl transferase [Acidimicrobiia bacterium]|nr:prolipoprotein diacylglyceryl transferase [Acidimicrobiia bacterium]
MTIWASIPSPPNNTIDLGPLTIHFYGILIGLGVIIAAIVTTRRYEKFGGNPAILDSVILWTVAIGFLGARIAYISTHTDRYSGRWHAVLFIWEGGLALYGGLIAGALAAVYTLRKHNGDFAAFTDAVAVGLPLAQAMGRFGNYFNQELFGTPTTLPWGLEIDEARRPPEYASFETFHPTFLYEALWNLLITVPLILYLERKGRLAKGASFPVYMIVYGVGRFLTELLRTDTTFRILGISRNGWVSIGAIIAGVIILVMAQRRGVARGQPFSSLESEDLSPEAN